MPKPVSHIPGNIAAKGQHWENCVRAALGILDCDDRDATLRQDTGQDRAAAPLASEAADRYVIDTNTGFDPDTLQAMGEAFDRARAKLIFDQSCAKKYGPARIELHQLAAVIIAQARAGECDADKLCAAALRQIGVEP